jgi:hypothetical protein
MDQTLEEKVSLMKRAVYDYWTWLPDHGLHEVASDKRTREAITAIRGIPILVSQKIVDETELSPDGSYRAVVAGDGRDRNAHSAPTAA